MEAASIDRSLLDEDRGATLDILDAICARFLAKVDNRIDRLEVANHLFGPAALLGEVASIQQADTPERLDRYEGRLHAFPAFLEASEDIAREAVATGVVAPRVVAERAIGQLDRVLALDAEDSPALLPVGDDPETRDRIAGVVRDVVNPAHSRFRDVLRHELLPVATETIGLSDLPGGDGMYAAEIARVDVARTRTRGGPPARPRATRGDPGGAVGSRGRARVRLTGSRDRRPDGPRREHRVLAGGAGGDGRGPGPPELGGGALVLRQIARGQLPGAARRGVPRSRLALRVLQPGDGGRLPTRDLLHQRVRAGRPGAAPRGERDLPRGEPRSSFPDRDRAGDDRPAAAPPVRHDPRRGRLRRRLGALRGAPRRHDGPLPRRVGADRACSRTRRTARRAS